MNWQHKIVVEGRRSWASWFHRRVGQRMIAEHQARRNDWAAERQALCPNVASNFDTWGEALNRAFDGSGYGIAKPDDEPPEPAEERT